MSIRLLSIRIESICVFRAILDDPVISALSSYMKLFDNKEVTDKELASAYSEFVYRLYNRGYSCFSEYLLKVTLEDKNVLRNAAQNNVTLSDQIRISGRNDLETIQMMSELTSSSLCERISSMYFLPEFSYKAVDIAAEYRRLITKLTQHDSSSD